MSRESWTAEGRAPSGGSAAGPDEAGAVLDVVLCPSLRSEPALDLEGLRGWLSASLGRVRVVEARDGPGGAPDVSQALQGRVASNVLVVTAHGTERDASMQAALLRAGIDPLGAEVVNLASLCTRVHVDGQVARKAKLLVAGAAARADAYAGSTPQNVKLCFERGGKIDRRRLMTLPKHTYRAVPAALIDVCAAGNGCTLCRDRCPFDAISIRRDTVEIDKGACRECAVCVTECPTGAMYLPGSAGRQIKAQLEAVLAEGAAPWPV